jgi:hypothetical protein
VLKLTIRDAEGVKDVQWGLPSPFFGEQALKEDPFPNPPYDVKPVKGKKAEKTNIYRFRSSLNFIDSLF